MNRSTMYPLTCSASTTPLSISRTRSSPWWPPSQKMTRRRYLWVKSGVVGLPDDTRVADELDWYGLLSYEF